jgi:hypothetical protein
MALWFSATGFRLASPRRRLSSSSTSSSSPKYISVMPAVDAVQGQQDTEDAYQRKKERSAE